MNHKLTLIAVAVIIMAVIPIGIVMSNGSDAAVTFDENNHPAYGTGFTTSSDGTLHIPLMISDPFQDDRSITITVTDSNNNNVIRTADDTIPAGASSYMAEITFRLGGVGSHTVNISITPEDMFPEITLSDNSIGHANTISNVTINVTQTIWSKTSTYIAIIVVVLLVVIAVYLHMRNAPVKKPETTFTDLERQKKEAKGGAEEAPRSSATERKRYKDSGSDGPPQPKETLKASKASKASAPPEEKKATTFTDLEKQKNEKKAAEPKKAEPKKEEPSSEEPKKIKYVSSRRK